MNRIIFLAIFVVVFFQPMAVNAQDMPAVKLFVGLRGFYQRSSLGFPESAYFWLADYTKSNNVSGGLIVGLQFSPTVSLRAEMNHLTRKFSSDYINIVPHWDEGRFAKARFEMTILDFPLLMQWSLGKKRLRPFVGAGVKVGMIATNKFYNEEFYDFVKPGPTARVYYRKPIFGILASTGVRTQIANRMDLSVEFRYHIDQGTIDVIALNSGSTDLNTSGIEAGIGLAYTFSRR